MEEDMVLLDDFSVPTHGLKVYRIERFDGATILWTTRDALTDYLKNLQINRSRIIQRTR